MSNPSNLLLASLSLSDLAALEPRLKPVRLQQMQTLHEAGDPISTIYFPTGAIISLVVALSTGEIVEAAMVGRDGVVGASSALDGKISLSRAIVQLSGPSLTCDVGVLKTLAMQSPSLLSLLIRHEQALYAQAQQSTACMSSHHTNARFCRWMLRARDLSGSDTLNFTQEFLAEMLGVGRTHITLVAHTLQAAGIIQYTRGKIHILDLEALREAACECYDTINSHYRALLGGQY